jgi:hypothetical protein
VSESPESPLPFHDAPKIRKSKTVNGDTVEIALFVDGQATDGVSLG